MASLQSRLSDLITSIGDQFKADRARLDALEDGEIHLARTSDLSRDTTTTLANDDVLITPTIATPLSKEIWALEAVLIYTGGTTEDFKFSVATTLSTASIYYSTTGDAASQIAYAAGDVVTLQASTSRRIAVIKGTVIIPGTTSSGVIAIQWAQNVSGGTVTRMREGSYMKLTKLV